MGESQERYSRIVRAPADDPFIIQPPKVLLDEAERLGQDPRRPRTAIARWVSQIWNETERERIRRGITTNSESVNYSPSEKELMERPNHFPTDFGLGLIPFPDDVGGWTLDKMQTTCYTSLSIPRPFDPHLHGDMTPTTVGFGYNYHGASPFPDRYDIVNRRGGGPRGGFAFTTGATSGNYPANVLPSPTFDLGVLGFSDGGWNPEGLQYTNRPKQMRLGGLRNGWSHEVFFVRSRQVMFRNVYGPMSTDEAIPQAPLVVINGSKSIHGLLSISCTDNLNTPRIMRVSVSSVVGRRSAIAKIGDTVQIYLAPRRWANPPLIFTGYISDIEETGNRISLVCSDALGFLANEIITTETLITKGDGASVIKNIIANSSYSPPLAKISTQSLVTLPKGLTLKGKTRLEAIQMVLDYINNQPTLMTIYADERGYIHLRELREIDDSNVQPYVAGRLPRTNVPQDFYPTTVERTKGDLDFFNVVIVNNSELGIEVTYPALNSANFPSRPVYRSVEESTVKDSKQALEFAKLLLNNLGRTKERFNVEGLPERFDIRAGEVMDFASMNIAGRQRLYRVAWTYAPDSVNMTLDLGRQPPNIISTLRYATGLSL